MLTTLRIKNLALVEDLTIDFHHGFNALTGETGAGKSVIIGGIQLLIGGRADKSVIRSGCEKCLIEAVFNVSGLIDKIEEALQELGLEPCDDDELIIRRSLSASGSSKQFVNGSPCSVKNLAMIGAHLVDIHGPHDAQSLNKPGRQIDIVDSCGDFEDLKMRLAELSAEKQTLIQANTELAMDEQEFTRQVEILQFQVQEIQNAQLSPEDEDNLEGAYQRASNAAQINTLCQEAIHNLSESETSVLNLIHQVGRALNQVEQLDTQSAHLGNLSQEVSVLITELKNEINNYIENLELDPSQLHELEEKFSNLQSLRKKYGNSIEEILDFANNAQTKLHSLEQREHQIEEFKKRIDEIDSVRINLAQKISTKRTKILKPLSKEIQSHLDDLGFKQNNFEINIETLNEPEAKSLYPTGMDKIEFMFSPNPGEPLKPLKSIASSGELARVMLGIKTVLASKDSIPLLVFDEVDANVGGETSSIVGEKLKAIGSNRQTICITHLAPVAAAADNHYLVEKNVSNGRTTSDVRELDKLSRNAEIARMLGGTDAEILEHAKALLKKAAQ